MHTTAFLRRYAGAIVAMIVAATAPAAPAAPATIATTATTAITAHPAFQVAVSGQGTPLILIPGLASSGEVWEGTVARLCGPQSRRQCHVLTLAGFAGVAPVDGDLLAQAETQLAGYISGQQLGRPVIVGHSLGGFLALKLALGHPQQAGKLIIVDALPALGAVQLPSITPIQLQGMATQMRAAMRAQDDTTFAANQRRAVATMASKPQDVARILDWGLASDRNTVADAMATLMGSDLRPDLARIDKPVLVLGTWIAYRDFSSRAAIEQTFRSQYASLPGARIELSDTARHFIMYDDPNWLHQRIEQFID